MKRLLKIGVFSIILLHGFQGYSQTISLELSDAQILSRATMVYGNDFLTQNPSLIISLGELLTERITFMQTPQNADEKYPALSSYPLMNKINPGVHGVEFEGFNLQSFNPLVYRFDFFLDKTQVMRIDNTNYIMIVNPITRN